VFRAIATAMLIAAAAPATAQIPPRSISPPEEEVADAFIGYIHGVIYNDAAMEIDGQTLSSDFPEFVPSRPTPFNDIELLSRTRPAAGSGDHSVFTLQFSVPLRYEVPVDILGHHPVGLQGSRIIRFQESIRPPDDAAIVGIPPEVSNLLVLNLVSGYMRVDFAPWLDFVGGRIVEDVDVTLIAVAQYRDRWFAMLGGYSPSGRPMSGVLDMQNSRFLVSPPRLLTRLARDFVLRTPPRESESEVGVDPAQ
jgi:hypothetical protein